VRNLNEPTINQRNAQRNNQHPSKHETGSSDHHLSSNTTIEERIVDCWPVALISHLLTMPSCPLKEEARATTADGIVIPVKFVTKPFPYHFQVKVRIDSLGDMGWGQGHIEDDSEKVPEHPKDWGVRVPLVLPGELAIVKIFKNMDDYSEGMERVV
jgi:hypothetical protein